MARDLFSSKKRGAKQRPKTNVTPEQAKASGMDVDGLTAMAQAMSGKSEEELQQELFKTAEQQMAEGTFDPSALDAFVKQAGPMLNAERRNKMQSLVGMLKNKG